MKYKDYIAQIAFDDSDRIFVGKLTGVPEAGSFHSDTVSGLEKAFQETVDHYLEMCAKLNQEPRKPYSGTFNVRISSELHAAIVSAAERSGKSMNQWIADKLAHSI